MKCTLAIMVLASTSALAQPQHRHHPPADTLHEKFYSTWYMPDNPARSCCNKADCYPTELTYRDGEVLAKRREEMAARSGRQGRA